MGLFTVCYRESSAIAPTPAQECRCRLPSTKLATSAKRSPVVAEPEPPRIRHKFVDASRCRRQTSLVGGRKVPLSSEELWQARAERDYRNVLVPIPEDDRMGCSHCEEAELFTKAATVVWIALTLVPAMGFFAACLRESSAAIAPTPVAVVRCACRQRSPPKRRLLSPSSLFKFGGDAFDDAIDLHVQAHIRHRFLEWPAARHSATVVGGRRVPFTPEDLYHAKMDGHARRVLCAVPEDDRPRCDYCEEPTQFTKAASIVWIALTQVHRPETFVNTTAIA
ncbi:hypothetical protein ACHHYP_02932 [Achlya hypogyna]|uniref:Uncharacterized protein n=1 Tax=Achlya hypogyna TaxID=1202772 RepID=A0A1V9Z521_ACHHY|nr:hypothetical protein ACHHYP_02932 [Achlya hypogyna]